LTSYAVTLPRPRTSTGGPKWDRDRVRGLVGDWWSECKEILARSCAFVPVPSPVRESLKRHNAPESLI
jgi:hypothetical protein